MLSNKWTFSLTYLVMLVAVGFAMGLMVTPDARAHELEVVVAGSADKIKVDPAHPKPTISVSEAVDVSSADGAQVRTAVGGSPAIDLVISFDFSTLVSVLAEPATNISSSGGRRRR